jgi:hypothetical protein
MIEAMRLNLLYRSPLEWHHLHTKCHEILPSGLKLLLGDTQTDRQTGDLKSLLSFFGKQAKNELSKKHTIEIYHITHLYKK